MRFSSPDFLSSRSNLDAAKTAMLSASSPVAPQQQQQQQSLTLTPTATAPTMLDRELLQHYAYLRYGDAGSAANGGRKQHVCPVKTCGRRFSTPGNLSRHKRLHGPIKPLKCPVDGCICAFRSENKLEKHMKFHLGIPVHVCPVPACGKTFSTAGNLNRHIKGHHPHVDPFDLKKSGSGSGSGSGGGGGGSVYSTSSSCDEYESSVGGDEVMRERIEEAAAEARQFKPEPQSPTNSPAALPPAPGAAPDQLDALVAILDQDIGDSEDVDMASAADASADVADVVAAESESMLSLLLMDVKPKRKYSLLDDMIRFHINHFAEEQPATTQDDTSSNSSSWVL